MANTNSGTRTELSFEFALTHDDVVGMMNDPQVNLDSGDVSSDQEFQLILQKSNGSEVLLRDMKATDTLVFRYKRVATNQTTGTISGIDIES